MGERTAVLFFFQDHEREAPILSEILDHETFYIGCQGSRRSSETRLAELDNLGVSPASIEKARGTAATEPLRAGRSLNEIAVKMGWGLRHAANIIEKYAATVPEEADEVLAKLTRAHQRKLRQL